MNSPTDQQSEAAKSVIAFFPEHADLFRRNDRLLKDVDRAITELTLRSVNETTKKLSGNITSTPSGPHNE